MLDNWKILVHASDHRQKRLIITSGVIT